MVEEGLGFVSAVGFGEGVMWKTTRMTECHGFEGFGNNCYVDYQDVLGR